MRLTLCLIAALSCPALSGPALANDGFGGFSATGLTFGQTEAVAMEEERLFIGIDKITVDYVFRNLTDQDVTGEVIFPMPPVSVGQIIESQWNLPEDPDQPNLVNFTATVDGQPVAVNIDRIAVIEPQTEEFWFPSSLQYDTPGRDVTADLARLGIPLSLNGDTVLGTLLGLDEATKAEVTDLGLAEYYDDGQSTFVYPKWSVALRYHWTQTFPAGKTLAVSHAYDNRAPGGLFTWSHPPEDYQQDLIDLYCIDEGTSKGLAKALEQPPVDGEVYSMGLSWNIAYILRTANSWAGPIKRFTLTIDKGETRNIVSLCADGIKKTGPTTFVMEKTDFTPERDLHILIATPFDNGG
jgi:hypothetical protein